MNTRNGGKYIHQKKKRNKKHNITTSLANNYKDWQKKNYIEKYEKNTTKINVNMIMKLLLLRSIGKETSCGAG